MSFDSELESLLRRVVREEVDRAIQANKPAHPEFVSIQDAATIAKVHHSTIRAWIRDGSLQAKKVGRIWRIQSERLRTRMNEVTSVSAPLSCNLDALADAIVNRK